MSLPIERMTEKELLARKDSIDWENLLSKRFVNEIVLEQVKNLKWEWVAKHQGISVFLFERLTGIKYFPLRANEDKKNRTIDNIGLDDFALRLHCEEIYSINWCLFAENAKLNTDHLVQFFINFIQNGSIFNKKVVDLTAIKEALLRNRFISKEIKEDIERQMTF